MQAPVCHGSRDVRVEILADLPIRADEDDACRKVVLVPGTLVPARVDRDGDRRRFPPSSDAATTAHPIDGPFPA
ncbi:hypothetical protein [Dokdonella sp.]|uniref:hypothetical protein n=1 Tax=Dokdonella sp. TaxID=2291710 RepID=UPI001B007475|nr:hypothetical protein [Dokdonella sp.]MBO9662867.1 hypothetical protein [Dokdonella sp.]